jgi:acyl-CoA thioesterase
MSLTTIREDLDAAVNAARRIHGRAERLAAASGVSVAELISFINGSQGDFEHVAPLLERPPEEVQTAAVAEYGSRAPANIQGIITAAREAGVAAVTAARTVYETAPARDQVWVEATARYEGRALGASAGAALAEPMAALAEALAPVARR